MAEQRSRASPAALVSIFLLLQVVTDGTESVASTDAIKIASTITEHFPPVSTASCVDLFLAPLSG